MEGVQYTKVTRDQIASFLNVKPLENLKDFKVIGIGVTDYGLDYNPQVSTEKWIIHKNATSSLDSYQIQGDVAQTCYYGDPVYDYVNHLRRTLAVGSKVNTQILDVDMYDEKDGAYAATLFDCMIAVTSYAKGENPAIEYSIYYNGDPKIGTVTFADKVPTFVETVETGESEGN